MSKATEQPTEAPEAIYLPSDPKTVFLGGIFVILALAVMRIASDIIMPIVLAFVLKLMLQPAYRLLLKLRIPRILASLLLITVLLSLMIGIGMLISGPAATWTDKLPDTLPALQHRLGFVVDSLKDAQEVIEKADGLAQVNGREIMPVAVQGTRLSDRIFSGTQAFISGLFTTILILYFLLVSGDTFLRRLVEVLPRFKDKRQAVDISQQAEHDISVYLLTITMMNAAVGIASGLIMYTTGVGDPVLWGTTAFLLNYIPVLGPMLCGALFLFAGIVTFGPVAASLLPFILYMLAHIAEGTFITPLLVARRFTLNPVLVVVSLVFWYWMWGFPGAILAVPLLTITKIICDRVHRLKALGHFLEG